LGVVEPESRLKYNSFLLETSYRAGILESKAVEKAGEV
jgi:hypothetical protein